MSLHHRHFGAVSQKLLCVTSIDPHRAVAVVQSSVLLWRRARRMDLVPPSDTLRIIHHDDSGKLIQTQRTTTHSTAAIVSQPRYADDYQYNIQK